MRAPPSTVIRARQLRRRLSPPEVRLWSRLRARSPRLPTFRRQHPIGPYVLDFYCSKARLAVEIDGIADDLGDRPERDEQRSDWLAARGITIVRIPASEVNHHVDEIADAVMRTAIDLIERAPTTMLRMVPLPRGAGEEGRDEDGRR